MQTPFQTVFTPAENCVVASAELINPFTDIAPPALLNLWQTSGLGKYRDGLIEFVDPSDFKNNLITWLGRDQPNYIPFAITGFGELLYYRKLSDTEEDVCMIDIQYRQTSVLCWGFDTFLQTYLTNEDNRLDIFREEFFNEQLAEKGPLSTYEVFTFVPILALGGNAEGPTVQKGNAQVYIDLVFTLTA